MSVFRIELENKTILLPFKIFFLISFASRWEKRKSANEKYFSNIKNRRRNKYLKFNTLVTSHTHPANISIAIIIFQ